MSERKEKFTPGPWFVNNCQVIAPNQPKIPFGERGQYSKAFIIAQPHLYVSGSQDEIRANTSLIAAAPELYEALKVAYQYLHSAQRQRPKDWRNATQTISTALQKARGE